MKAYVPVLGNTRVRLTCSIKQSRYWRVSREWSLSPVCELLPVGLLSCRWFRTPCLQILFNALLHHTLAVVPSFSNRSASSPSVRGAAMELGCAAVLGSLRERAAECDRAGQQEGSSSQQGLCEERGSSQLVPPASSAGAYFSNEKLNWGSAAQLPWFCSVCSPAQPCSAAYLPGHLHPASSCLCTAPLHGTHGNLEVGRRDAAPPGWEAFLRVRNV